MKTAALLLSMLAGPLHAQGVPADTALNLRLNVPAYRLDLRRGGALVRSIRVAIGQRRYPTPIGQFRVGYITWNPWWYPPPSPWAARDTATPPCPTNPVGRVKLSFGSSYFIHGTPAPRSLGQPASHGCVRVAQEDVLALAADIVTSVMPDSAAAAARYAAGTGTKSMLIRPELPLRIVYELAELRGDTLWMYPDVYRRVPATVARVGWIQRLLADARRPPQDPVALLAAVTRSRRAPTFLLVPPAPETLMAASASLHLPSATLIARSGRATNPQGSGTSRQRT